MTEFDTADAAPRRVLMSAYACGPDMGPEASAGWAFAVAAAQRHTVHVITRPRFADAIRAALDADPALSARLRVHFYDPPRAVAWKRRAWDLYWFYPLWQRGAGRLARELHGAEHFDVAHHITFANDWMPAGITSLREVPIVWGPVGGSSTLPIRRLARWLGVRGTVTELARAVITRPLRALGGDPTARRARLVVAQNPQVEAHFRALGATTVVEPNASLSDVPARSAHIDDRVAMFAGRLVAWKGAALAIDALVRPELDGWRLHIFGSGHQQRRLERMVARRGLSERVRFFGEVPRDILLGHMSRATVFLFPSMHDQAGWVAAEASSIGCPVVCLPLGGPPLLAEPNAHIASLEGDIPRNVARAVLRAAAAGGVPTQRWTPDRLPAEVTRWYAMVADPTGNPRPDGSPRRRERPIIVLESFGTPKETTNPYITQLHRSLARRPDVTVRTFNFRSAILGRYDLAHVHWPELLVGGHRPIGRAMRRALTAAVILRWNLTRTPIVRTLHNLERPSGMAAIDGWLLDRVDARTVLDLHLNDQTPPRDGIESSTILHGHYRDWFARFPQSEAIPGRVAYVGLIRRYKGVEDLVDAFTAWRRPGVSLHIAGHPSSADLLDAITTRAGEDERVTIDPRFLSEVELAQTITSSQLIVLPYRHMHNSGTALAALSLGRAVLVPDNEVNRALAHEVGAEWVHTYTGALGAEDIESAWEVAARTTGVPDLSGREWDLGAAQHVDSFRTVANRTRHHGD